MEVPAAVIVIMTLILANGLAAWRSDITIGIMVNTDLNVSSLPEVVDNVTRTYRPRISNHGYNLEVKWAFVNSTNPTYTSRAVCGMIKDGVHAVVTVLRCLQRKTVSSMAETFRIPHLSIDLDLCPRGEQREFTLHVNSRYKTMTRILTDIIEISGWKQIQLNFNKVVDSITRQHLLVKLSSEGIRVVLPKLSPDNIIIDDGIILVVDKDGTNSRPTEGALFLQSTRIVFIRDVTPETVTSLQLANNHTNVLVVHINAPPSCDWLDAWSNKRKLFHETQVSQAVSMFCGIFKNMVQTGFTVNSEAICGLNQKLVFKGGHQIFQELTAACGSVDASICYKLSKPRHCGLCFFPGGSDSKVIRLGQWTEDKGVAITTTSPDITNRLFSRNLADFKGITLRVVVYGLDPYAIRLSAGNTSNTSYIGMMIDIMDDLANKLNFRYTVTEPPDGQYGAKNPDGTFSGMVGMVARGEADIGADVFTVNTERSEVVDFTTSVIQDSLGILTPQLKRAPDMFNFLKPFTRYTWLTILGTCLIAFIVFAFISLKSPTKKSDKTNRHPIIQTSVGENVLLIISAFFEQGPTFHPTAVSARWFLVFWLIFTLLTSAMYTAHLAAVLTVSTPIKPIDTLQDLADRTDMGILAVQGGSDWSLFKQSEQPLYKEIASRLETTEISEARFDLVKEGRYCHILERSYLEYVVSQSCGKLRLARDKFYGFPLAFIIGKHSPYKEAIDHSLQKMVESGLIGELFRKWMTPKTDCPSRYNSEVVREIGLDTLGGIFIVYLAVTFVSVIVLIIEFLNRFYFPIPKN